MVLCHSMNVGSVVGHTMRWWGLSSPTLCEKICFNFLHSYVVGLQNFGHECSCHLLHPRHLVKLSLFVVVVVVVCMNKYYWSFAEKTFVKQSMMLCV